jgi:hypothetical protein
MNAEATNMNPVPARKRRTRVRRLVGAAGATLLTGAMVTGVGQPAHAFTIAYNLYDLDGNGQTDASVVDATGRTLPARRRGAAAAVDPDRVALDAVGAGRTFAAYRAGRKGRPEHPRGTYSST